MHGWRLALHAPGWRAQCKATPAMASEARVYRVVLTGGPCGGKSSALPCIAQALRDRGVPTVTLPEMATSLVDAGVDRVSMIASESGLFDFNRLCAR